MPQVAAAVLGVSNRSQATKSLKTLNVNISAPRRARANLIAALESLQKVLYFIVDLSLLPR
jgi:hypothetical protein